MGAAYALSPMLMWFFAVIPLLLLWSVAGIPPGESRWVAGVFALAVISRLCVLAAFFLTADRMALPFGILIPDEWFLQTRSMWLRNVALDIPVEPSVIYELSGNYGQTGLLYVLALVHIVFGPSPYGVHLLNMLLYLAGAVALHRTARRSFGPLPALGGFILVLFLPTLFVWSISALKEPSYFFLCAIAIAAAVKVMQGSSWGVRAAALFVVITALTAISTLRSIGLFVSAVSVVGGIALYVATRRAWLTVACGVAACLLLVVAARRPDVRTQAFERIRTAAVVHIGHVKTPGYAYKLLDPYFYSRSEDNNLTYMTAADGGRFVIRALASFFTVPLPWRMESTSAVLLLPQQLLWYLLAAVALAGTVAGMRRDPVFTSILMCNILAGAGVISLHNGNVGTFVRFRDTVVPFLLWLSALGGFALLEQLLSAARNRPAVAALARDAAPAGFHATT